MHHVDSTSHARGEHELAEEIRVLRASFKRLSEWAFDSLNGGTTDADAIIRTVEYRFGQEHRNALAKLEYEYGEKTSALESEIGKTNDVLRKLYRLCQDVGSLTKEEIVDEADRIAGDYL